MYENVLLATDGSDDAREAARHAVSIADAHGAKLHALYVIETRTGYDSGIVDPETVERELRAEGEEILEQVETAASPDLSVSSEIRRGVPAEEILAYIEPHDIDIVVLGGRGKSDFKRILLGSTSEAIISEATIPVVVLPGPPAE